MIAHVLSYAFFSQSDLTPIFICKDMFWVCQKENFDFDLVWILKALAFGLTGFGLTLL